MNLRLQLTNGDLGNKVARDKITILQQEGGQWSLEVIDGSADEVGRVHRLAGQETRIGSEEGKFALFERNGRKVKVRGAITFPVNLH